MNCKILICDDARFIRITLKDSLEKEGYQVIGEADSRYFLLTIY